MSARPGDWGLLGEVGDPIVADAETVVELTRYYQSLAEEITAEAEVLRRIGDGDDSDFRGLTADAVRAKSKEVAGSLRRMAGRYEAVRDALTAYIPNLEHALDESAAALRDAENASAAAARAASMPDPAIDRSAAPGPTSADALTAAEARHHAAESAASQADAAALRLRRAVDLLNTAGQSAAEAIRASWDDGLHDTLGDRIRAWFVKFLKILVKVLTYIGVALAFLAIAIPGLGLFTLLSALAASFTLVANFTLAGMGEGSWLDVITSAIGLVLVGAGAAITKAVSTLKTVGLAKSLPAFEANWLGKVQGLQAARTNQISRLLGAKDFEAFKAARDSLTVTRKELAAAQEQLALARGKNVIDGFKEKPNWWQPGRALWTEDKSKLADVVLRRNWRADRLFSVDRQLEMTKMQREMAARYGVEIGAAPAWHSWAAGGRVVLSWGNTIVYGQGLKPTGWGEDTGRIPGLQNALNGLVRGF